MTSGGETLQWGGRFSAPPDEALLAFGSSLEDDLTLAPFDVRCSLAHVAALRGGAIVSNATASALEAALHTVADEIADGSFTAFARTGRFEDVHGAIDARIRELAGEAGDFLHSGRSRNDQVATTLLLYARDRAAKGRDLTTAIARSAVRQARSALADGTVLAATTHWQPAQPMLLAFWLGAVGELFARCAFRFEIVEAEASLECPLGSGAATGSTLPLDRSASAAQLGFAGPSRNALDAIGNRDSALNLLHAVVRALLAASRPCEELIVWCTPAFGFARLADSASTGSSLMPQKRNPDPFELVRAAARSSIGDLAGALGTTAGLALSYHRDLQETKRTIVAGTERGLAALDAFARAFDAVTYDGAKMSALAGAGFTTATDAADALIARGISARHAHTLVGSAVAFAESQGKSELGAAEIASIADAAGLESLDAPLDVRASLEAKRTAGSTGPQAVAAALDSLERTLVR
jgi:argininosuccinate lyase